MEGEYTNTAAPSLGLHALGARQELLRLRICFGIFIVIGALLAVDNSDLPIIRNAFSYAKMALGIVENDFDFVAVARDSMWTSGRPIFFSVLASPLVWVFGGNTGVVVASALGTVFFLWMAALVVRRMNWRAGLAQDLVSLEFVFVVFNPLVLYQFWSGYPDSLFAGLVLLAFLLTDTIATEPERDTRWHIVGLGITIYVAIHTKLYGAVLGIVCPLYLAMHWQELVSRSSDAVSKVCIFGAAFLVLAAVLLLAKFDMNPLLHLSTEAGFDGFVEGVNERRWQSLVESLYMLGFALILIFHASLVFLFVPAARRAWSLPPTVFIAIYLAGLLTFGGTSYNMRYFLPALPFLAIPIAADANALGTKARRIVLGLYGVVALVLVLNFNVVPVHKCLHPLTSELLARHGRLEGWLNNLRIAAQLKLKSLIDQVNVEIPAGSVLYWSSSYYYAATHGLGHHLGIKDSVDLRYVLSPREIKPDMSASVLVMQPVGGEKLRYPPAWAIVEELGPGLFRLNPFFVECGPLSGDTVTDGQLNANAIVSDRLQVEEVEFLEGDKVVGVDRTPPFQLSWVEATNGRHELSARGRDGEGRIVVTAPAVCYAGVAAGQYQVTTRWDIATEESNGAIKFAYRSLEMSDRVNATGVRFDFLDVPRDARLSSAYLDVSATAPGLQPAVLEIGVELTGNAQKFEPRKNNLSDRVHSAETVKWESVAWAAAGERQRSPNLAPMLEKIFAQPDWKPGNAVAFIIRSSGRRDAQGSAELGQQAPSLYIELEQREKIVTTRPMARPAGPAAYRAASHRDR